MTRHHAMAVLKKTGGFYHRFWWRGMLVKVCYPKLAILFPGTWARLSGGFFFRFLNFLSPKSLRKVDFPWFSQNWHMAYFSIGTASRKSGANLDEAVESPKFSGWRELLTLKIFPPANLKITSKQVTVTKKQASVWWPKVGWSLSYTVITILPTLTFYLNYRTIASFFQSWPFNWSPFHGGHGFHLT